MATALAIASLVSTGDGETATLTLDGTPTGMWSVGGYQTPVLANTMQLTVTGNGPYVVEFPYPGLWFVWVADTLGACAEPTAVLVSTSTNIEMNDIGLALQNILIAHRRGIECYMVAAGFPTATLKQVVYGEPNDIIDYPCLLVTEVRVTNSNYIATSFTYQETYGVTIAATVVHNDEPTLQPLGVAMAKAAMDVLNLPDYEQQTLPSGLVVAFCRAASAGIRPIKIGENYASASTISWSCLKTGQPNRCN